MSRYGCHMLSYRPALTGNCIDGLTDRVGAVGGGAVLCRGPASGLGPQTGWPPPHADLRAGSAQSVECSQRTVFCEWRVGALQSHADLNPWLEVQGVQHANSYFWSFFERSLASFSFTVLAICWASFQCLFGAFRPKTSNPCRPPS